MDSHLLRFKDDKLFVFIDFETENLCLNFSNNVPWQMAMLKSKGGEKTDERDIMIEWDRKVNVSAEAAKITRFSYDKYNKLKIPHTEAFEVMEQWLEEADYIVGHNILGFDMYLISEYYKKMGKSLEKSLKRDEFLFKIIKKNLRKTKNSYFNFNVTISKKKYLWMIKSRYISCLLDLKESEINNGLDEIKFKYKNIIKFVDTLKCISFSK